MSDKAAIKWPDRLEFDVTEEDIGRGVSRHCTECPIARALTRALQAVLPGSRARVWMAYADTWVFTEGTDGVVVNHRYGLGALEGGVLPQTFINTFDADKPVQPARFVLVRCES